MANPEFPYGHFYKDRMKPSILEVRPATDRGRQLVRKCRQCARQFSTAARHPNVFCSKRCRGDWRIANNTRRQACCVCAKRITGKLHSTQRTCGAKECTAEMVRRKTRAPKPCPRCGKEFWPVRQSKAGFAKYCSLRCYNDTRAETMRVTFACAGCGATRTKRRGNVKNTKTRFCSKECQHRHFKGDAHPLHRGLSDPNRGPLWNRLAESIRQRDKNICRRCGKDQVANGGKKLHVDHLLPWRYFTNKAEANDPMNLAALCMSCHASKTGTVERRFLRGDRVGLMQFIASLNLPTAQVEHATS